MYISHLSLTNFRVFKSLEVDVPPTVTVIIGNNAQGKTSFLEAVNFFSTLTSVQTGKDKELINFQALEDDLPVARLLANYHRENRNHTIEAHLVMNKISTGNIRLRKEVLLDGIKRPLQHALGNVNSVIFLPQMTEIIEGSPEERRRYLDITISQVYPRYAHELSEYNQAIIQRNALLKILGERGGNLDQLDFWDERIAEKGSFIMHMRWQMLGEFEQNISATYMKLSEGGLPLNIVYLPAFKMNNDHMIRNLALFSRESSSELRTFNQEELRIAFLEKLHAMRKEDLQRGITMIGPHRDEMRFFVNQVDMGIYGSRGQIRTILMALKIGEMTWLYEKTGEWPILLLDEILAEMDLAHRESLLHVLSNGVQTILTSTDVNLFAPAFLEKCQVWHMEDGHLIL